MGLINLIIHLIFLVLITILYYIFFQSSHLENADLIIGILSKRDNFENRKILRKTWLNYVNYIDKHLHKKVKAFFIIGKQCPIPFEYRESFYSCDHIQFNSDEDLKDSIKAHFTQQNIEKVFASKIYNGISFKIQYPIIVTEIGILCSLINNHSKVFLTNAVNEDIIVELNITDDNHKKDNFCFSSLSPYIQLPKNFYAAIKMNISNSNYILESHAKWNNRTTILKPLMVYHSSYGYTPYTGAENLAVSFLFKLADFTKYNLLKNGKNKTNKKFLQQWKTIDKSLEEEILLNDIILVDAIDTYRNLTNKLLYFMQWLKDHYKYKYFLKTDDDCYLDLISIVNELESRKFQEKTWWGKNNWPVNLYGKWGDLEYPGPYYPAFACGSGHIISSDLINWILLNHKHLHRYQGEDVSLGIWLASILPKLIQDDKWFCGEEGYDSQKYAIGQLNSISLVDIFNWKNIQNGYKLND